MRRLSLLLVASGIFAQTIPDHFFFEKDKIRVLILTGRNNHEWRQSTPFMREVLESTGRFDVRVTEEPAGLTAKVLRPYDVLLSDYCGPRWGPEAEAAVEDFVSGGKGLVVVHAASYPFGERKVLGSHMTNTETHEKPWPAWAAMVGASWSDKEPVTGHGPRDVFRVQWKDPGHPIAKGLSDFLQADELYRNFRLRPSIHVLATGFDDPAKKGNGRNEPLLWVVNYGKGRVFHTALGHDVAAMQSQGFQSSLARGTEWAATGKVELPAALTTSVKKKDAVRVLLVTGGHDHAASFYGIFEHDPRFLVNVDPHPVAFRHDIRKDYDVLVLYDSIQDLPENQRQNLREFVESGKGLVLLHHSIVDFQSWEWWWREVMGGLYVLKDLPEEGLKASSFLHDVELVVRPRGTHPVVKGLPPMRLDDETYKGVWSAPGVNVILETDHPTSDKAIGWISPYPKSKVVYIQPGHGREAHENPWYRRLVHNAILWSAGRTN